VVTKIAYVVSAAVILVAMAGQRAASAQTPAAPAASIALVDPRDGACIVTVNVPKGSNISLIAIYLNDKLLTVGPARWKGSQAQLRLRAPLQENDFLVAELFRDGPKTQPVLVQQATQQDTTPNPTCDENAGKVWPDDRAVFEASGYLGRAFENFAQSDKNNYKPVNPDGTSRTDPGINSRFLAGVEAQYRLFGEKGHSFQVWLASYTLHGVRTSDVDCSDGSSDPICKGTTSDKFLAILEHASSLEAHIDARVEFATLQKKSEMPIKAFAAARFGFVSVEGAPQVYNNDSLGVGILSPVGVFRGSSAQVAWGQSEQFQSNPGWNRLKIAGTLLFDLAPGFKDRLEFWKRLAGSPRAFIAITVDRGRGGPDSVTTYVGMDFDLRGMFFGF